MAERVDVCIVGSGFGGSIAAWRLAELYTQVGEDPSVVVLERGMAKSHGDFRQSMDIDHLSDVYGLIQGQGAQIVVADLVGGGSNLYLAASLRAPSETFERQDRNPSDPGSGRVWPSAISRSTLDPYYTRIEAGLRVEQPGWDEVSKSGGVWAAMLDKAGHSCDRVPLAINSSRCVDAKWCYTGCIFAAKNSLITNYLASAVAAGVDLRPQIQVNEIRRSSFTPYRYLVKAQRIDPVTKTQVGAVEDIECKVLILAAGAMGTPPILMRSQQAGALPSISTQLGQHLGVNGDHVAAIEFDPAEVQSVLGLPDYNDFFKGKPITTMSYDWWVNNPGNAGDGKRFTLQEILLSQLTNILYDDGRGAPAGDPSWWGKEKKQSISTWNSHIEILAMVEDTHDGAFFAVPPNGGGHVRPNSGPVGIGLFNYALSPQSTLIREQANAAIEDVIANAGLGKFLKLTETQGSYASHPLGGCRMAESKGLGVVDHHCEVFDNEGLFCMDSSAIPSSLGVNPSLTISAVCERAAESLVLRAADFGLPAPSKEHRFQTPFELIGPGTPGTGNGTLTPTPAAAAAPTARRRRKRKKRKKHRRKKHGRSAHVR